MACTIRRTIATFFIFALFAVSGVIPVLAQEGGMKSTAPTTGFRADVLADVAQVQKKLVDLADAIPQEKYTWRPMEGVRSVSEVYMHIAGSNYYFLSIIGVKAPEKMGPEMEKVTDKAKVVEFLKGSMGAVSQAVKNLSDADLDKPAKLFGQQTTERNVLFMLSGHMHEHLGQLIAYARMNKVVPPWSASSE